jgi:aminoglycoside phosphotransferase (APT) family kinase protein
VRIDDGGLSDLIGGGNIDADAREPCLSLHDATDYLLARELISPRAIVDSDLVVRDFSSSRNCVFGAECSSGMSYLLKQNPHPNTTTGARERDVYEELSNEPAMRKYLPRFHGYDVDRHVIVLEFIRGAEDLASYHRDRRRPPLRVASAIGAVLAELHRLPIGQSRSAAIKRRPSSLSLHRPDLRLVRDGSPACLDLVRIVQRTDGYGSRLDELNKTWSATTLVHSDVRLKNFVLTTPVRTMRHSSLKLIDWELACLGDPRWDIGSALGNYLSLWLASIPMTGTTSLARSAQLARCPLSGIQPAIQACWDTYVKRRGLDAAVAHRLLPGTVGFAAARLVQTAFETALGATRLTTNSVLHLQVALNMLQRPEEAARQLLGLPIACASGVPGAACRGDTGIGQ